MAVLIAFLIIVPAVISCHCCPASAQTQTVGIESVPCHACCSSALKAVKDCAVFKETASSIYQDAANFVSPVFLMTQPTKPSPETAGKNFHLHKPPHETSPLGLISVLRI